MPSVNAKTTSVAGAKWLRRAKRIAASLPKGGSRKQVLDGFLLRATNFGRVPKAQVIDIPSRLTVFDDIYDDTTLITNQSVVISASRDAFLPDTAVPEYTTGDTFPRKSWVSTRNTSYLFAFGAQPDPDKTRKTPLGYAGAYDGGDSKLRRGYAFRYDADDLQLYPYDHTGSEWVLVEINGVGKNDVLQITIDEATISNATGGYKFYPRGLSDEGLTDRYPISVPQTSCARRVLPDGRDIAVMAIPVTKPLGDYDPDTNTVDAGYAGVYVVGFEVTTEGAIPVALDALYANLLTVEGQAGPLSVPQWSGTEDIPLGDNTPMLGVMPNRMMGDVAIDSTGQAFWAGIWETSRETTEGTFKTVMLQNVVSCLVGPSGILRFTTHYTSVYTSAVDDTNFGYLSMDSYPDSDYVPYINVIHCFSPEGTEPFFVALAPQITRSTIGSLLYEIAPAGSSQEVWCAGPGVTPAIIPAPQHLYFAPGELLDAVTAWRSIGPEVCLLDANPDEPVVSMVLRDAVNTSELVSVEVNLAAGTVTTRGSLGLTSQTFLDLFPQVTCYQRAQSELDNSVRVRTHEGGMVVTYGDSGEGFTLVSKDSGATWTRIANIAGQRGAYYTGNGFFGAAYDRMFREVDDNGND